MGTSSFWNPQGLSRPVMGLFYLYFRVSMLFYVFVLCETSVTVYKPRWRNISVMFSGVPSFQSLHFAATYEGWNFNSGNYLFTTDTKYIHVSKFYFPSM